MLDLSTFPQFVTVREAADILRVDPTTIGRWIKAGVLKATALPNSSVRRARDRYRISRSTLEQLIQQ